MPDVITLTPRQQQVLQMRADGYSPGEIAQTLFLSTETIKSHLKKVAKALGSRNYAHMVSLAYQHRLLTPGTRPGHS